MATGMVPTADIDLRLTRIEQRVGDLENAVLGNTTLHITGLASQLHDLGGEIEALRADLATLLSWRKDLTNYMRFIVTALSVLGFTGLAQLARIFSDVLGG